MRLSKILKTSVLTSLFALSAAATAHAVPVVSASVGGAPSGVIRDNLDALSLGSGGGVTATGITVSFSNSGQAVTGNASGVYAAPFLTGSNGTGFGSPNQPNGADGTTYLSAGGTGIGATLTFGSALHYVGLLWGSIDTYNTLYLYNGATLVGTITGSAAAAAASTLPNGNQGANGTAYVNITSTDAFDTVVAESNGYAFEFDNIAYSTRTSVPEPLTLSLFGAGLAGAAALRRKKAKKA